MLLFLYLELLVNTIAVALQVKLLGAYQSRSFYTQAVFKPEAVPGASTPEGKKSESTSVSTGPESSKNTLATENSMSAEAAQQNKTEADLPRKTSQLSICSLSHYRDLYASTSRHFFFFLLPPHHHHPRKEFISQLQLGTFK